MSAPQRGTPTAPLTVGVVGAGRVGTVLGAALAAAGHRIVAVSARSARSRARAARMLPGVPVLPPAHTARAVGTGVLLLTVPDDALAPLVDELVAAGGVAPGQVAVHTSGAHGATVLRAAAEVGAGTVALHPAMTFTGRPSDLDRLPGVSYGASAPDRLRPLVTRLVADLQGVVEWVHESDRLLYHAALAHGANHLVTLVNDAADGLRAAGVREPRRLLAPLLRAALDNALGLGDDALTGPVARGDAGTVAGHLSRLAGDHPDWLETYRALARRSVVRAVAAGRLDPRAAGRLLDVLAGTGPGAAAEAATAEVATAEVATPDLDTAAPDAAPVSAGGAQVPATPGRPWRAAR
ncbi:MAG TPA: DUF2520 domain-containing protein [Natronosporangium sp.]|nr:DUF2520 domain-containing protein [Natronosporangium sp.]